MTELRELKSPAAKMNLFAWDWLFSWGVDGASCRD